MARSTRTLTTLVFAFAAGLGLLVSNARAQDAPAAATPAPQIRTGVSDYMYLPEIGTTVVLFGLAVFAVSRSPTRS